MMATKEQVDRLANALGVQVLHSTMGAVNSGGTAIISLEGMTPEQATSFIDDLLVPMRNGLGFSVTDMSFAEGKGANANKVTIEDLNDEALKALEGSKANNRSEVRVFMQEHGLYTISSETQAIEALHRVVNGDPREEMIMVEYEGRPAIFTLSKEPLTVEDLETGVAEAMLEILDEVGVTLTSGSEASQAQEILVGLQKGEVTSSEAHQQLTSVFVSNERLKEACEIVTSELLSELKLDGDAELPEGISAVCQSPEEKMDEQTR